MPYQGYEEFLCKKGHYQTAEARSEPPAACAVCGDTITHAHSVDTTNGYREEHAATRDGAKQEIGFDDNWKEDHHGNRYAEKILRFMPHPIEWTDLEAERAAFVRTQQALLENRRWTITSLSSDRRTWSTLNEYDAEEQTFKFLDDVSDRSLVHEFPTKSAADKALQVIFAAYKNMAEASGGSVPYCEVIEYDIRGRPFQ